MIKTALQAKVEARNLLNAEYNRLLPILQSRFATLVGQKILRVNGSLMGKFSGLRPEVASPFQIWRNSSKYSLSFGLRICMMYGESKTEGCHYDEVTLYVGDLFGQFLKGLLKTTQTLRTDFSETEILAARRDLEEANKAARLANSKLAGFGEYDR